MIRALFYTGRHRPTTTDGEPVTEVEIAARLRREARERALDSMIVDVMPETWGLSAEFRLAMIYGFGYAGRAADARPEQLGAMSV